MRQFAIAVLCAVCLYGQGTPISTNTWTKVTPSGPPASLVGYDKSVYATAIQSHVAWGTYHVAGSEPNQALVSYSYAKNRWDILDTGSAWHSEHLPEGGHAVGMFTYMSSNDNIAFFSGSSGSNQAENPWHLYWYDVLGKSGRDKLSTPKPWPGVVTSQSTMVFAPNVGKIILYPNSAGGVSVYDPATNDWSTPSVTGTSPGAGAIIYSQGAAYNPTNGKIYFFGGWDGTYRNAVHTFDPTSNTWATISTSGTPPSARYQMGWAYSTTDNLFLLVGGLNGSGAQTDSFTFNPTTNAWTTLSPAANFTVGTDGQPPFDKLTYDPTANAFVMMLTGGGSSSYADGTWANFSASVWIYCLSTCSNVGTTSTTYTPTAGSLNRTAPTSSSQSWAKHPAMVPNGSTLYLGFIETGASFESSGDCSGNRPYVYSTTDLVTLTPLPSPRDCDAIASELSGALESHDLQMAHINSTLWISYGAGHPANAVTGPNQIYAKSWGGSSWSGGAIAQRVSGTRSGFSVLFGAGTTPTIARIEYDMQVSPGEGYVYVEQHSGSWAALGGVLNVNADSRAEQVAGVGDGTDPWVCWTESVYSDNRTITTTPQLYCKEYTGGSWAARGGSLNISGSNYAFDPHMTSVSGTPYVAFTERTESGSPQLHVKQWNGSAWVLLGSVALNRNTTGWVTRPRLTNDGTNVWLAWQEHVLGSPAKVHLARWDGSKWLHHIPTENVDKSGGSAAHLALAYLGSTPVVAFGEVSTGNLRQMYAKAVTPILNTITIENEGSTTTNHPVQIGRVFAQGELPSGVSPQAYVDGTAVDTQVDSKAVYSDGSLKHAIISFLVPTFTGGSTYTVAFGPGSTVGNTALTKTQMLDAAYNFDAEILLTSGATTKGSDKSARDMLNADDYTTWTSGPIATTILLGNHAQGTTCGSKAASAYDFGFDSFCSFRPMFEATFWPTINKVRVRYIGEITNTEQMEDVVVDNVVLKSGNTSPSTVYTLPGGKSPLTMHGGSRWTKTYWINTAPRVDSINHNLSYLAATKALPNYDTSKTVSSGTLATKYSAWTGYDRDLYGAGTWMEGGTCCNITSGGSHPFLGPVSSWTARWLYTGDYRAQEETLGNTDLAGAFPVHFREGNTAKYLDRSSVTAGVGRIVSVSGRPKLSWIGSGSGWIGAGAANGGSSFQTVGTTTSGGFVQDAAHMPTFFAEYLLTGDHYYLDEAIFWTGWATWYAQGAAAPDGTWRSRGATGAEGGIPDRGNQIYQLRGEGWTFLGRVQTAWMIPDAMPEKAYFTQLTNDAIGYWEGQRNITTTALYSNDLWDFGYATAFSQSSASDNYWATYDAGANLGIPPLRFWDLGNFALCDDRVVTLASTDGCIAMWMQDYLMLSLGRGRELGYATDALLAWVAPNVIGQVTDAGFNPYISTAYRTPAINSSSAHFTTWAQVKSAFTSSVQSETDYYPGTIFLGTETDAGGNVQPVASVLSFVADQTNGQAAWAWANTNIVPHISQDLRWATLPRSDTVAAASSSPSSGPSTSLTGRISITGR